MNMMYYSSDLIALESEENGFNSFFCDDLNLHLVTRVNVTLPTRDESILDDFHNFFFGKISLFVQTISVRNNVVQQRNDVA